MTRQGGVNRGRQVVVGGCFLLLMLCVTGWGIVRNSAAIQRFKRDDVWESASCLIINGTQFKRCIGRGCSYHAVYVVDITVKDKVISGVEAYAYGGEKYAVYRSGDLDRWRAATVHSCWFDKSVSPDPLDRHKMNVQLEHDDGALTGSRVLLIVSVLSFLLFLSCFCFAMGIPCKLARCVLRNRAEVTAGANQPGPPGGGNEEDSDGTAQKLQFQPN